jgi:hypothetical protein
MKKLLKTMAMLMVAGLLAACGGGGGGGGGNNAPADPAALDDLRLSAGALDQVFQSTHFNYSSTVGYLATATTVTPTTADAGATVTVNGDAVPSGHASDPIVLTVGVNDITIVVTAADGVTTDTYKVTVTRESADQFAQRAYIKASNTDSKDEFGYSVALSGDTLAVGAIGEASNATGVFPGTGGDESNNSAGSAGAVYVFTRNGVTWTQQAYVKASNTASGDNFGYSASLSGDMLAVGAPGRDTGTGAGYLFTRSAGAWSQVADFTAAYPVTGDSFGSSLALSVDTLAVGARGENSAAVGIDGDQTDVSLDQAGAVFTFQ